MRELQIILGAAGELAERGERAALATVVDVQGSSYRLPGAKMIAGENGTTYGTVSGGCLEADVLERATQVMRTGAAEVFVYDTTNNDDSVFSLNMGCRGVIRILLERPGDVLLNFFRSIEETRRGGLAATLIQVSDTGRERDLRVGARLLLGDGGRIVASDFDAASHETIAADALAAMREGKSKRSTYEFGEVFFDLIAPPVSLVVFGAGADAIPLVEMSKDLGWHVTVIDHRAAFATPERFPGAEILKVRPEGVARSLPITERTVAVVMTHNYEHDKIILRNLLRSPARYVGSLGPKRRAERLLGELRDEGEQYSDEELSKLYAPIGLDIGADTPAAIALSVIAEIQSILSGRTGGFLRNRRGSIYDR